VSEVAGDGDPALLGEVSAVLVAIRGAKSQAKVSMRTEVATARFSGSSAALAHLRAVEADLRAVGRITGEIAWTEADGPVAVDVTLAPAS
jgi:valyl-tRNA synthetase